MRTLTLRIYGGRGLWGTRLQDFPSGACHPRVLEEADVAVILDDLRSAGASTAHRPVLEEAASDLHKSAAGTLRDAESDLPGQGCCRPELLHSFIHSFSNHLLNAYCVSGVNKEINTTDQGLALVGM